MLAIDDLRDFDAHLRVRSAQARERLREALSGHRLTLREARVHHDAHADGRPLHARLAGAAGLVVGVRRARHQRGAGRHR